MNDIQKARDVLAKWRRGIMPHPWSDWREEDAVVANDPPASVLADGVSRADARLIVGTAGNPELLDAIDAVLNAALVFNRDDRLRIHGRHLAAAIIAADERMSS